MVPTHARCEGGWGGGVGVGTARPPAFNTPCCWQHLARALPLPSPHTHTHTHTPSTPKRQEMAINRRWLLARYVKEGTACSQVTPADPNTTRPFWSTSTGNLLLDLETQQRCFNGGSTTPVASDALVLSCFDSIGFKSPLC